MSLKKDGMAESPANTQPGPIDAAQPEGDLRDDSQETSFETLFEPRAATAPGDEPDPSTGAGAEAPPSSYHPHPGPSSAAAGGSTGPFSKPIGTKTLFGVGAGGLPFPGLAKSLADLRAGYAESLARTQESSSAPPSGLTGPGTTTGVAPDFLSEVTDALNAQARMARARALEGGELPAHAAARQSREASGESTGSWSAGTAARVSSWVEAEFEDPDDGPTLLTPGIISITEEAFEVPVLEPAPGVEVAPDPVSNLASDPASDPASNPASMSGHDVIASLPTYAETAAAPVDESVVIGLPIDEDSSTEVALDDPGAPADLGTGVTSIELLEGGGAGPATEAETEGETEASFAPDGGAEGAHPPGAPWQTDAAGALEAFAAMDAGLSRLVNDAPTPGPERVPTAPAFEAVAPSSSSPAPAPAHVSTPASAPAHAPDPGEPGLPTLPTWAAAPRWAPAVGGLAAGPNGGGVVAQSSPPSSTTPTEGRQAAVTPIVPLSSLPRLNTPLSPFASLPAPPLVSADGKRLTLPPGTPAIAPPERAIGTPRVNLRRMSLVALLGGTFAGGLVVGVLVGRSGGASASLAPDVALVAPAASSTPPTVVPATAPAAARPTAVAANPSVAPPAAPPPSAPAATVAPTAAAEGPAAPAAAPATTIAAAAAAAPAEASPHASQAPSTSPPAAARHTQHPPLVAGSAATASSGTAVAEERATRPSSGAPHPPAVARATSHGKRPGAGEATAAAPPRTAPPPVASAPSPAGPTGKAVAAYRPASGAVAASRPSPAPRPTSVVAKAPSASRAAWHDPFAD
jgi:hypothetical protein